MTKVNPSYTSQICSRCKTLDKSNRKGESFICGSCNLEIDADLNASVNILHRGVYNPSVLEKSEQLEFNFINFNYL